MKPDRFRTEMLRHMGQVASYFDQQKNTKRIDGLDWHFSWGADGFISDDFGDQVSFERNDNGTYKVTTANGEHTVDSLDDLRERAREKLTPVEPNL